MRCALLLLAVCAVAALAHRPCDGKGPCSRSSSHHSRRRSSSHSKEEVIKAKVSHSTSSDHPAQCKFECPACRAPDLHSSFFIGKDVVFDYQNGAIEPVNKDCRCKHGTQYAYHAINPKFDFGALFNTNNLIVARLRCHRAEDLCVETSGGQFYHGVKGKSMDIQPVPYTNHMGKTRTYLTVVPSNWNNKTSADVQAVENGWGIFLQNDVFYESRAFETLNVNGVTQRRLNFDEYPYVEIIGVDCNGCRKPFRYCDKAIRNTYAR